MAEATINYQNGTASGIDSPVSTDTPLLAYYMEKFYHAARGHLVNKYHVGFWGPYVDEALRIMDRNSYADKYSLTNVKTFKNTTDAYLKAAFNQWADMFYDREILSSIIHRFQWLSSSLRQVTYVLLTRSPWKASFPFDLHVLGMPPALILSQDQTLHKFYVCLFLLLIISNLN